MTVFPVDPCNPAPTATPTATPCSHRNPGSDRRSHRRAYFRADGCTLDVEMVSRAVKRRLNVCSGAGIGNSIIARLNDGSKVTVLLLVEGDWSYIRATVNGNVIEGYVSLRSTSRKSAPLSRLSRPTPAFPPAAAR